MIRKCFESEFSIDEQSKFDVSDVCFSLSQYVKKIIQSNGFKFLTKEECTWNRKLTNCFTLTFTGSQLQDTRFNILFGTNEQDNGIGCILEICGTVMPLYYNDADYITNNISQVANYIVDIVLNYRFPKHYTLKDLFEKDDHAYYALQKTWPSFSED